MVPLSKMLHKRKISLFLTIMVSVLTATLSLWWNAQLSQIINQVSVGILPPDKMILWALFTMFMIGVFNYIKTYCSKSTCEKMAHDLRMGYAHYFLLLSVEEAEKIITGEQLSKLQNEINAVSTYLNMNLFQLFDDGVRFLTTLIWLSSIHLTLTLAPNLPVVFIIIYILWSSKIIGIATESSQEAKGVMNQFSDTLLTMFPIIRLYQVTPMIQKEYKNAVNTWEKQTIRAERTRARLMSLSGALSLLPLILLFLVGGHMVISGTLTIGTLYICLNLSGNVSGVMKNMPSFIASFQQFSINMKRLSPYIVMIEKGASV